VYLNHAFNPRSKIIGCLVILASLVACSNPGASFSTIHRNPSPPEEVLSSTPLMTLNHLPQDLTLSDFFAVETLIPLENHPAALLGDLRQVLRFKNDWWVLNESDGIVYRFGPDGHFKHILGGIGEGPGHYQRVDRLETWGDRLVVIDNAVNELLFFDAEGQFLAREQMINHQLVISFNCLFYGERMFAGDYLPHSPGEPNHLVLQKQGDAWQPLWGFGQRLALFDPPFRPNLTDTRFPVFIRDRQRIWAGSPYFAGFDIYDLEGRHLKTTQSGVQHPTLDDWSTVRDDRDKMKVHAQLYTNINLVHMGSLVFGFFSKIYVPHSTRVAVYDRDGNLLRARVEIGDSLAWALAFANGPYMVCPQDMSLQQWQEKTDMHTFQRLLEAGFEQDENGGANPVLVAHVLKDVGSEVTP